MTSDQTVQCDVLTHCAHLCMLYEWVFCSPVGYREVYLPAAEIGSKLRKSHELSDREECQEFKLHAVQMLRSQFLLTRTNATSFPVTLSKRIASRFEDRLDSDARRFLRLLVLFVVVTVDHEELVYILVESFAHVRRAFFCILVLLEQNQVVDSLVLCEDLKHLPQVQLTMPISQYDAQSGQLLFGRGLAKLEDLGIAHIGDQLLRLFAEFLCFFSLMQVLQERLLVRVILELLNQLLTVSLRFVSSCSTAEWGMPGIL